MNFTLLAISVLGVFECWQPKCHICACGCKHHIFRVELNALDWSRMISIQDAHFEASVGIPDMHSSICTAGENKLRVWTVR